MPRYQDGSLRIDMRLSKTLPEHSRLSFHLFNSIMNKIGLDLSPVLSQRKSSHNVQEEWRHSNDWLSWKFWDQIDLNPPCNSSLLKLLEANRFNQLHLLWGIFMKVNQLLLSQFFSSFLRDLTQVLSFQSLLSQLLAVKASMNSQWVVDKMRLLLSSSRMPLKEASGSALRISIWSLRGSQAWRRKSSSLKLTKSSDSGLLVSLTVSSHQSCSSQVWRSPTRLPQVSKTIFREPSTMWLQLKTCNTTSYCSFFHGSMLWSKREESIFHKDGVNTMNSHLVILRLVSLH